jgi:hypothetical protein
MGIDDEGHDGTVRNDYLFRALKKEREIYEKSEAYDRIGQDSLKAQIAALKRTDKILRMMRQEGLENNFVGLCERGGRMPLRIEKIGDLYDVTDLMKGSEPATYAEEDLPANLRDTLALLYLTEPTTTPDLTGALAGGFLTDNSRAVRGFRFSDTVFYIAKEDE